MAGTCNAPELLCHCGRAALAPCIGSCGSRAGKTIVHVLSRLSFSALYRQHAHTLHPFRAGNTSVLLPRPSRLARPMGFCIISVISEANIPSPLAGVIFLFFNFVFYKNIFLFSKFTGIYSAAPLPGGRGFAAKSFAENLRPDPWRTGCSAAGRPAPQAARLRGDRLPLHYIRVWLPPHPSFASLKL